LTAALDDLLKTACETEYLDLGLPALDTPPTSSDEDDEGTASTLTTTALPSRFQQQQLPLQFHNHQYDPESWAQYCSSSQSRRGYKQDNWSPDQGFGSTSGGSGGFCPSETGAGGDEMPEEFPLTYTVLNHDDNPEDYRSGSNNNSGGSGTWRRHAGGCPPGPAVSGGLYTTHGGPPVYSTFRCRSERDAAAAAARTGHRLAASSTLQRRRQQHGYENQPRLVYSHQTSLPADYPPGGCSSELTLPPPPPEGYLSQLSLPAYVMDKGLACYTTSSLRSGICDTPTSLRTVETGGAKGPACETPLTSRNSERGDSDATSLPLYSHLAASQQLSCDSCLPPEGFELTALPSSRHGDDLAVPSLADPVQQQATTAAKDGPAAVGDARPERLPSRATANARPVVDVDERQVRFRAFFSKIVRCSGSGSAWIGGSPDFCPALDPDPDTMKLGKVPICYTDSDP
jgi:hypothetical protein